MPSTLTRRRFLKLIAAATAAAALWPTFHARARYPTRPIPPDPDEKVNLDAWAWMGRAIQTVTFYDKPSTSAERLTTRRRDQSFTIVGEVHAPFSAHNDLWYKTTSGYVHSAWVLPVRVYPPQPYIRDVGAWGFWGEISQVFTNAHAEPSLESRQVYRFYGGNVFHIVDAREDDHGTGWYKVYDEFPPTSPTYQWVLASDVRHIPHAEMSPIHPFAGEKRIEVDLGTQQLTCYERDQVVFTTPVASGLGGELATPAGEKCVLLKQASRHMCNRPYKEDMPPPVGEIFDLPGIPWNTFFDLSGMAIHGTYWHNDFGVPRSHGCLNVSCDAARWIYRWVHPIGGYEDDYIRSNQLVGTPIHIF